MKKVFLLIIVMLLFSSIVVAQSVTMDDFKVVLISAIQSYFSNSPVVTVNELKDLIVIYFTANSDVVDLSKTGTYSGKKLIDVYNKAKGIELIDTLDYIISDHLDKSFIHGHKLSETVIGNRFYLVKWGSNIFQMYEWDDQYVYLREDNGRSENSYSFTNGRWVKRYMRVGETLETPDNIIKYYKYPSCNQTTSGAFPLKMTLEQHIPDYNVGGNIGDQDVIVLKYEYAPYGVADYEKEYWSREWGLIRWEDYDASGKLRLLSVFNVTDGAPTPPEETCLTIEKNAQFVSQNVPATMEAGSSYSVSVTMKNTGTTIWTADKAYRLGSWNPKDNLIWGVGRVFLSDITQVEKIYPGQTKTFIFTVRAPSTPGTYNFQWRMLQENVQWFGETTLNVPVSVKPKQ